MNEYLDKLLNEGMLVLKSPIPSGHPILHDQVDSMLFHKWVLNCIGFLATDAPDHVAQIKAVHKPDIALHHQAVQIFAILSSAAEVLKSKREKLSRKTVAERPPSAFSLEFIHPETRRKVLGPFLQRKVRRLHLQRCQSCRSRGSATGRLGRRGCRSQFDAKGFKPASPILKFSDVAAEQEAAMNLFCGFIGVFKNPHSHTFPNVTDPLTAFEIMSMANHLCTMVGKTK